VCLRRKRSETKLFSFSPGPSNFVDSRRRSWIAPVSSAVLGFHLFSVCSPAVRISQKVTTKNDLPDYDSVRYIYPDASFSWRTSSVVAPSAPPSVSVAFPLSPPWTRARFRRHLCPQARQRTDYLAACSCACAGEGCISPLSSKRVVTLMTMS
jgi:hypothetical protein